jgi:hypothetical protein
VTLLARSDETTDFGVANKIFIFFVELKRTTSAACGVNGSRTSKEQRKSMKLEPIKDSLGTDKGKKS